MKQKHHKSRREMKNEMPDDFNPSDASKRLYQNIIEMKCVEDEIMELYHDKFNIDPYDESEAYFSEEEQIERYAQNIVFWTKLEDEYPMNDPKDIMKYMTDIRFQYIKRKSQEVRMMIFMKFQKHKNVLNKMQVRTNELLSK